MFFGDVVAHALALDRGRAGDAEGAAGHAVGSDQRLEDLAAVGSVEAVGACGRTGSRVDGHLVAMGAVFLAHALELLHGNARDLGVLFDRVRVDGILEHEEAGAHRDAVDFALEIQIGLGACGVERRLAGGGVDAHILGDRLARRILLLGIGQPSVGGTHDLVVVGVALIDDDQMRRIAVRAPAGVPCGLLGRIGQEVLVVGLVLDEVLCDRRIKRAIGGGLDGDPVDAGHSRGDQAVGKRGVDHVDLEGAVQKTRRELLRNILQAAVAAGERTAPEQILSLVLVGAEGGAIGVE